MIKAYSYSRVSSKEQLKGTGPQRQLDAVQEYCKEMGYELNRKFYIDEGVSGFRGKNSLNGKLAEFRYGMLSGEIKAGEHLVIENFDRLSRMTPFDALGLFMEIINAGVTIDTMHDRQLWNRKILRKEPDRLSSYLTKSVRAFDESSTKSKRMVDVWIEKRSNASSKIITKRSPAWIDWTESGFKLIEERAEIIRRIFQLSADGLGEHKIATLLNIDNTPTWGDNGRDAATMWRKSYISKILHSEAVIGTMTPQSTWYDDDENKHVLRHEKIMNYYPTVIDLELWNRVVSLKQTRSSSRGRHSSHAVENILGGLARCKHCGSAMTRVMKGSISKAGSPKLVCTSAKTGKGCSYASIRQDVVEDVVKRLARSDFQAADEDHYGSSVKWQTDLHREELAKIKLKLEGLTDIYMETGSNTIHEGIRRLTDREKELKDLIRNIDKLAAGYSGESLRSRLKSLVEEFDKSEIDRQAINSIMRSIYKEVVIDVQRGEFEFEFHSGICSCESVVPVTLPLPPGMSAETAKAKLMAAFKNTKPV